MAHPAHVEYTRFYNRYPYEAKRRTEDSPEGRGVQRAGDPKLMNDTLRTRRVCALPTKMDPFSQSVDIGLRVDTSFMRDFKIKYELCVKDKVGLTGCDYQKKNLFSDLPGKTLNTSTWQIYSATAREARRSQSVLSPRNRAMSPSISFTRAMSPLRPVRVIA
ncbi:hypothetical protein CEUSTIGMA_g6859.t1 [Chlamydomonas eustigma]|uniref:Uncharacterized protein n=1 Tax=Chlamydomonas eustigma TaxID=1157962 RepID=A0A250X8L0_9CHLO|nr:hypothetical protein CEUSTIGMA_g6859.t1 [Chlamydomonas eustigma]|eukprot:GAX79418.1 hypothetical protein CEUSTIGMA_g6859.t1 [Chlamydomonas eustigma]